MKVFGFVLGCVSANPLLNFVQPPRGSGRPTQTKDDSRELPGDGKYPMFQRLVRFYNREFHPQQHWAYGCNCMMMVEGEPMEKTSYGAPVDDLDKTCKKLKDCYKCVKDAHGPRCTPEKTEYDIFFRGQDVLIGNRPGTCERDIFECDSQYAQSLMTVLHTFNNRYNFFSSGFDPISEPGVCRQSEQSMPVFGSSFGQLRDIAPNVKCCGSKKGPFQTYNANIKQCCKNGAVKDQTERC